MPVILFSPRTPASSLENIVLGVVVLQRLWRLAFRVCPELSALRLTCPAPTHLAICSAARRDIDSAVQRVSAAFRLFWILTFAQQCPAGSGLCCGRDAQCGAHHVPIWLGIASRPRTRLAPRPRTHTHARVTHRVYEWSACARSPLHLRFVLRFPDVVLRFLNIV